MLSVFLVLLVMHVLIPIASNHLVKGDGTKALVLRSWGCGIPGLQEQVKAFEYQALSLSSPSLLHGFLLPSLPSLPPGPRSQSLSEQHT